MHRPFGAFGDEVTGVAAASPQRHGAGVAYVPPVLHGQIRRHGKGVPFHALNFHERHTGAVADSEAVVSRAAVFQSN